jgi:predicted DNA-binding protein with PD1-like motif
LNIQFGTFELLGGLSEIEFTAYDFVSQTRLPPLIRTGAMEITGGHGTISLLNGQPHIHTHLVVSFRDESVAYGIGLMGGHVSRAICYAVEFTLTAHDGAAVHRVHHSGTGLKLWNLPALLETK